MSSPARTCSPQAGGGPAAAGGQQDAWLPPGLFTAYSSSQVLLPAPAKARNPVSANSLPRWDTTFAASRPGSAELARQASSRPAAARRFAPDRRRSASTRSRVGSASADLASARSRSAQVVTGPGAAAATGMSAGRPAPPAAADPPSAAVAPRLRLFDGIPTPLACARAAGRPGTAGTPGGGPLAGIRGVAAAVGPSQATSTDACYMALHSSRDTKTGRRTVHVRVRASVPQHAHVWHTRPAATPFAAHPLALPGSCPPCPPAGALPPPAPAHKRYGTQLYIGGGARAATAAPPPPIAAHPQAGPRGGGRGLEQRGRRGRPAGSFDVTDRRLAAQLRARMLGVILDA